MEKSGDRRLEIVDAQEYAAPDCFIVEVSEPTLDEIHPAGTGGNEMRDKPGMTLQPRRHFVVLMGAVVVHDQMKRNIAGKFLIESASDLTKPSRGTSKRYAVDRYLLSCYSCGLR